MNILVDTHIALWSLYESSKLSKKAKNILSDNDNTIIYSTVSVWEIDIKKHLHPESIMVDGETFARNIDAMGFSVLPLINKHIYQLKTLTYYDKKSQHKDPFDRILISQAKAENMIFISHDILFKHYKEPLITIV